MPNWDKDYGLGLFCVACGEFMENPHNHHCDPKLEEEILRKQAVEAMLEEVEEQLTDAEMMELGFELLSREDNDDD